MQGADTNNWELLSSKARYASIPIAGFACRKKPLKIIVTSATLDGEKFSAYFGECPVLRVSGRLHDVKIIHSQQNYETDVMAAAIDTALDIHEKQAPGDILVFMTGQNEIDKVTHSC